MFIESNIGLIWGPRDDMIRSQLFPKLFLCTAKRSSWGLIKGQRGPSPEACFNLSSSFVINHHQHHRVPCPATAQRRRLFFFIMPLRTRQVQVRFRCCAHLQPRLQDSECSVEYMGERGKKTTRGKESRLQTHYCNTGCAVHLLGVRVLERTCSSCWRGMPVCWGHVGWRWSPPSSNKCSMTVLVVALLRLETVGT